MVEPLNSDWYWIRAWSISVFDVTQQLKIDSYSHILCQIEYPVGEL